MPPRTACPSAASRLSTSLLALLLATSFGCRPEAPEGPEPQPPPAGNPPLIVASFGGAWQDAQREAMFGPFAKDSGSPVEDVEYDGSYSLIREKGAAGEWDLVDVEPVELLRGAAEGIYTPIGDLGLGPEELPESARHPFGVALMTYGIVLGYDSAAFPDPASAPATWADLWDVDRFPGTRALRDTPEWMLEIALMADGVPRGKVYPIDLDRAFRSLERIEGSVVFFDDWAAPAERLAAGEVAMAVGTNGRLAAARDAGESVGMSWHGGLVSSDYFVIPKGSTRKERAMELVRFAVGREAQAAFPVRIDYGPVNRRAQSELPAELLARLPSDPSHAADSVRFDAEWWLEHEDDAHLRYEAWMTRLAERR